VKQHLGSKTSGISLCQALHESKPTGPGKLGNPIQAASSNKNNLENSLSVPARRVAVGGFMLFGFLHGICKEH
jgi:hypothetical protein